MIISNAAIVSLPMNEISKKFFMDYYPPNLH